MLELLFVIGFFVMLLVTGVSLLGIIAAIVVATALMFVGGLFALMIKLLPWLLLAVGSSLLKSFDFGVAYYPLVLMLVLAVVVVWIIRALKSPNGNAFRDNNRWRY